MSKKYITNIPPSCYGGIDLHVHSTYFDGTFSPKEIILEAERIGLKAIALTDHDTVSGCEEMEAYAKELAKELIFIPGTEISAGHKDRDVHIVGLFINYNHRGFLEETEKIIKRRENRNLEMIELFNRDGIDLTIEEVTNYNPDTIVTRAHFARCLINRGIVRNNTEAFDKYLSKGCTYYVPRKYISKEDAVKLILEAGGIPVLAHPLSYNLPEEEIVTLIEELISYGLKGIECTYSTYSKQDEYKLIKLANKYNLLKSGGSDFHGKNKPDISLGAGLGNLHIPFEYYEKML